MLRGRLRHFGSAPRSRLSAGACRHFVNPAVGGGRPSETLGAVAMPELSLSSILVGILILVVMAALAYVAVPNPWAFVGATGGGSSCGGRHATRERIQRGTSWSASSS